MEQIAEQIVERKIAEMIPEIQRAAYVSAYNNLIGALEFDITMRSASVWKTAEQSSMTVRHKRFLRKQ